MLERWNGRNVKVVTQDGSVFTGEAEAYPSGYGLHEFGVEEESVSVEDTQIFLSDIVKIEALDAPAPRALSRAQLEAFMGMRLEGPYLVADILPGQAPQDASGRYFAVERYFRAPERLGQLRRTQAELLLRLNCFYEMRVSFDNCETWETDPEPEAFVKRTEALRPGVFLRALFPGADLMIDIEPDDTHFTAYCPAQPPELLRALIGAAGLFLWTPPENG